MLTLDLLIAVYLGLCLPLYNGLSAVVYECAAAGPSTTKEVEDKEDDVPCLKERIGVLEKQLRKMEHLREDERRARINAQKRARAHIQQNMTAGCDESWAGACGGWRFSAIGVIESQFPDRRGTPRQPILVPASRYS